MPVPQTSTDRSVPASRASIIRRMSAGITWLDLRVEVVAGTVQVDGQKRDGVEAVLLAVRLALHE